MKYIIISIFFWTTQLTSLIFGQVDPKKVVKIAKQMSVIGPECRYLSSKKMKERRLAFLNDNKDATIQELIGAIEMELDGQDIITLLKSFNCDVCNEYAASIVSDHSRGDWAIKNGKGNTTVETLLWWGFL